MNWKKRLFVGYSEFDARYNRGNYLVSIISDFASPEKVFIYSTGLTVTLPKFGINLSPLVIISIAVGFLVFMKVMKYFFGWLDEMKIHFWHAQSKYNQSKEHLVPFNTETRDTLIAICKELKIPHHYKDDI